MAPTCAAFERQADHGLGAPPPPLQHPFPGLNSAQFGALFGPCIRATVVKLGGTDFDTMAFLTPKQLSCGIVILNEAHELLLCHVTGQGHWDLPKGGIDAHERPIDAALRETREETGLSLDAGTLLDLGRLRYLAGKDLHLFATCMARIDASQLKCESYFLQRPSGRRLPEMDGFGWFGFERATSLCTPKMAATLGGASGLARLLARLTKPRAAAVPLGQPSFAA